MGALIGFSIGVALGGVTGFFVGAVMSLQSSSTNHIGKDL